MTSPKVLMAAHLHMKAEKHERNAEKAREEAQIYINQMDHEETSEYVRLTTPKE